MNSNGQADAARNAGYIKDDRAAILKGFPFLNEVLREVKRLKEENGFSEDTEGDKPDAKDKGVPDSWVPRNAWMNRLTGIHPFNAEAPLSLLKEHGFLTPNTLHYVRNHGYVPGLSWHSHSIDVSGLVDRPMKITMAELVKLPTRTFPVTLNCCGNRRKEQNLIQKTIGFNWGAAAVSTAVWTGVPLIEFFKHVGIKSKEDGANFINFFGPVGEVPQGDTSYGASHYREVCLNPTRGCMLVFMMNGELLHPDHGYPVRLLVPGYIGGRMIKWVSRITVTEEEDDNHYHVYDNKYFPKYVTSRDEATRHGLWKDPAFRIDDRVINSAMWSPAHCEKVPLSQGMYTCAGYAMCGAGRPIMRVEVTLNDGHTWMPAKITRFEKPNEYGFSFCWVHWTLDVPVQDLRYCTEFAVRAWDDCQNTQKERPDWTLMGQNDAPWFRVKVHDVPGSGAIWFEHPTRVEPGLDHAWDKDKLHLTVGGKLVSPGWMERLQKERSECFKPLPLEEQPLDGEAYNDKIRFLRSEKAPTGEPADKAVGRKTEANLISLSKKDGKGLLAGKWQIPNVDRSVTLTVTGESVKSEESPFGNSPLLGEIDKSEEVLEMHITMGGFPMKAWLRRDGDSGATVLEFSNGGKWSKI